VSFAVAAGQVALLDLGEQRVLLVPSRIDRMVPDGPDR
jgi:hypothetical protein